MIYDKNQKNHQEHKNSSQNPNDYFGHANYIKTEPEILKERVLD